MDTRVKAMHDNDGITSVIAETITVATGELTKAANAPRGAKAVEITGTANAWQFTPKLRSALWNDAGVWSDLTEQLSERGTTRFAEIDSFAASNDFLYIGCNVPFRGVRVNIKNANGTASVATWEYWNGTAWADISDTDATAALGATLAIDNIVTWTPPSDWVQTIVNGRTPLFWVRLTVSVTLDSDTQIAEIVPLAVQSPSVAPLNLTTGGALPRYSFDPTEVGGLEVVGDNTELVTVNWLCSGRKLNLVAE